MPALTLSARPERKAVRSGEPGTLFVALRVRAEAAPLERARPDIACALVLDVSGSMSGPPLEMLVRSVEKLCELAQPTDRLAMVAFSDSASVLAPLTPMDAAGRRLFASRARRLMAEGGTNMEDGLREGGALLATAEGATVRRSLLLLSDGQPNRGACQPLELARVVQELRPRVATSTLGYGIQHSEDVLVAIAEAGGGRFQFVPDPASCRRELASALGAQSDVVAGSIELVLTPADGIEIKRFVGDPPVRFARGGVLLGLSDMESDAERIVAIEIVHRKPLAANGKLFDGHLTYLRADTSKEERIEIEVAVDVTSYGSGADPEASALILLARAEETRKQARALADGRNFAGAAALVRRFLTEIAACPGYVADDGSPLAEAYEQLLDEAVAFERNPSAETYSVLRKQTIMQKLDGDGARSIAPVRGAISRRFVRPTSGIAKPAYLVMVGGVRAGKAFQLGDTCCIGRTSTADLVIASNMVSRRHAEIYLLESDHWICDLGSTSATMVNGKRLTTAPHKLEQGDSIRIGDVELRYMLGSAPEAQL